MLPRVAWSALFGGRGCRGFPEFRALYRDFFDFVERDGVAGAVVELGGPRAFVRGDLLSLFERPTVFEVGGDTGGSEGVVTNRCRKSDGFHPAFDHRQDVGSVERSV